MNARNVLLFATLLTAPATAAAQNAPSPRPGAPTFGIAGTVRTAPQPATAVEAEIPAPPDARTIRSPWLIAIDTHIMWPMDPRSGSFQRDPGTAMAGPGVSLARDLVPFGRNGALQLGLVFAQAASEGLAAQTIHTQLQTVQLGADATLRIPWLTWLTPHVRLGAGAMMLDARVASTLGNALSGTAWSALGTLGAGFSVHTAPGTVTGHHPTVLIGVRVEGGYQLGSPASIDVRPPSPPDATTAADRIVVQPTHLGTILPHGPYLRLSFIVRF